MNIDEMVKNAFLTCATREVAKRMVKKKVNDELKRFDAIWTGLEQKFGEHSYLVWKGEIGPGKQLRETIAEHNKEMRKP